MKSTVSLQDKLIKQNEISGQRLARELWKIERTERSNLRMIETERQRFRSRHKHLEPRLPSTGSNAINVRMYETHNPGFCYHCNGAIRECGPAPKENAVRDSYEFVRSIIFTGDEVDPRKVLCLHLFTAHTTRWNNNDGSTVRPVIPLVERAANTHAAASVNHAEPFVPPGGNAANVFQARRKQFSGPWNNALTCYVVDTEDASAATAENVKLHEDPRKRILEELAARDFEEKCRQYMGKNDDLGKALSSTARNTKIAQQGLKKMPAITPHVYSLLGPSHELRIKQALAEGMCRRKLARSSLEASGGTDGCSYSFHLDEDDDTLSRVTTNESNRNCVAKSTLSPSRRSTVGSTRLDHRFTMLKSKRSRPNECGPRSSDTNKNAINIKSSFRAVKDVSSKTSSIRSPSFRGLLGSRQSSSSILSMNPDASSKIRKCVYLNTSNRTWLEKPDKNRKIVPILVNYQIQALVQTVLDVLGRVNPEKSRLIVETARDTDEIKKMLLEDEMQSFAQSLVGQSLMTSPDSYVVSTAVVMDEIDVRFGGIPDKEIVALTLEMPSAPSLEALIADIRNSIFSEHAKGISSEEKLAKEDAVKSTVDAVQAVGLGACEACDADASPDRNSTKMFASAENRCGESAGGNEAGATEIEKDSGITGTEGKSEEYDIAYAKSGRSLTADSLTMTDEHRLSSGNVPAKRPANAKSWKAAQDPGHLDADHVILRRMTNTQRILVGQMCASLKSKRINNQGLINESVPLAALIAPVLSRDSIKILTRGTTYSQTCNLTRQREESEENVTVPDKITGLLLAKIRQDVAETETKRRLKRFLDSGTAREKRRDDQ